MDFKGRRVRVCPDCDRAFTSRRSTSYRNHMNKEHTGATCEVCTKPFYNNRRKEQHARMVHGPNTLNIGYLPGRDQKDDTVNELARTYHDRYAKVIKNDAEFDVFNAVIKRLAAKLKEHEYINEEIRVGSVYEGTNVEESDYDVLFVKKDSEIEAKDASGLSKGSFILSKNMDKFSGQNFRDKMKGHLQTIINEGFKEKWALTIRDHGPALQLDVDKRNISIDIVPSVQLNNGDMYVAKKDKSNGYMIWRKSHSYEARKKLEVIDRGSLCHREVVRTCKVLRNKLNLQHITSYQIKCVIFKLHDETPKNWDRSHLGERVIDTMKEFISAYTKHNLVDSFDPEINLLRKMKVETTTNTANRLTKLVKNPYKLF